MEPTSIGSPNDLATQPTSDFLEHETGATPPTDTDQASWLERFLSPQSLQRLMICGGGLMILGFVIWLWTKGVFENPLIAASTIGAINLAVLGCGVSMIRWTRYQLAGRGLTHLAALVMPLNLWFYDSQGLLVLAEGGALWVPAMICCVIYGSTARLLRDPAFVFTFMGGVVMTGMLFLADTSVDRFWQLLPHATFLCVVGCGGLLAELLFAEGEGEFSRRRFGRAFRFSGSLVLLGGMGLLAGGQLLTFVPESLWDRPLPLVTHLFDQKVWALGLILGVATTLGIRGQALNSSTERQLAIGSLGWALVVVLDLFGYVPNLSQLMTVACIGLTADSVMVMTRRQRDGVAERVFGLAAAVILTLTLIPVAATQFLLAFNGFPGSWYFQAASWTVVVQLLATFVMACVVGLRAEDADPTQPMLRFLDRALHWAGGGLLTMAVVLSLRLVGVTDLGTQLAILTVVPVVYGIANWTLAWNRVTRIIESVAGSYLVVALAVVIGQLYQLGLATSPVWLAGVSGGAALLFTSIGRRSVINRGLAMTTASVALINLARWFELDLGLACCSTMTLTGLGWLTAYAALRDENSSRSMQPHPGYLLVIAGSVAAMMLAGSQILGPGVEIPSTILLLGQLLGTITVGILTGRESWRLALRATSVGTAIVTMISLHQMLDLSLIHRYELLSIISGIGLLILGHSQWSRETDDRASEVTVSLYLGSILTALPLAIGLILERVNGGHSFYWWMFHEVGALTMALLLVGSGVLCRIRWTTIGGGMLLGVYVASLLILIPWPSQLQNVSIGMMAGGAAFFGGAILLSIYRDRLVSLPVKFKQRAGIFQILNWR